MKTVFKNSALVFVLAGLLSAPFFGFRFIGVEQSNQEVLGINTYTKKIDTVPAQQKEFGTVVTQIEINLNLSKEKTQRFYDVIPSEYVSNDYNYLVIYPNKFKQEGIEIKHVANELSIDLEVFTQKAKSAVVPVTVLVVEK